MVDFSKKSWQWITLIGLAILWGSSFILMKRGLEVFSDMQVAAYRITITFLVLLPIAVRYLKVLRTRFLLPLIALGLFGNAIPAYLFTKAQTMIDSSIAGMLNSTVPLFTLLLGVTLFSMRVRWINVVGVLIGLGGTIGLFLVNGLENIDSSTWYGLYCLAATTCYGIAVNLIKKYLHRLNAVLLTALAFLFVGPFTGIHLLSTDFVEILISNEDSWIALGYITVLGVLGTALAVVIFNMMIKHTTALFATTVTYLIPVVAILWGLFDGESLKWTHFMCMGIILCGVYLVNREKRPETKE